MNFVPESNGTLMLLNANKYLSKIVKLTDMCSKEFTLTVFAKDDGSLFTHPYDTEVHGDSVYVTSQDSNLLARFSMNCTDSDTCVKT